MPSRAKSACPHTVGYIPIRTGLREYESCLKLDYTIHDRDSGELLTKASTMQIAVRLDNGETQYQTPADWQARIHAALAREAADGQW